MADVRGIEFVYRMCAYLPLLGVAAAFLPNLGLKARTSGR
jgi:FSR family fosmidomycin resistance protein-like MFS transporter